MEDGLHSEELHERLKAITDRKVFADEVFKAVTKFRDQAKDPDCDYEIRRKALDSILEIFVEYEEYEKCSFIRDLINEIDG